MESRDVNISTKPITYGELTLMREISSLANDAQHSNEDSYRVLDYIVVLVKGRTDITEAELAEMSLEDLGELATRVAATMQLLVDPLSNLGKFFDKPLDPTA